MFFKSKEFNDRYKVLSNFKLYNFLILLFIIIIILLLFLFVFLDVMYYGVIVSLLMIFTVLLYVFVCGKKHGVERLKRINNITQSEWDSVCDEFNNNKIFSSDYVYITDNYYIDLIELDFIKLSDIIWVYYDKIFFRRVYYPTLAFWTVDGKVHYDSKLSVSNKNKEFLLRKQIMTIFKLKCNNLIIGYSEENRKLANSRFIKKN